MVMTAKENKGILMTKLAFDPLSGVLIMKVFLIVFVKQISFIVLFT